MGLINVTELQSDMVLASPLIDRNGRFLLGEGTVLTKKHLRVLKIWGVIEADVEGISQEKLQADITAHQDPDLLREAQKQIHERFIHADLSHPAIKELFRICILRRAKEIGSLEQDPAVHSNPDASETDVEKHDIPEEAPTKTDPADIIRKNEFSLSTLPTIFMQINETIKKPNSSANDIQACTEPLI